MIFADTARHPLLPGLRLVPGGGALHGTGAIEQMQTALNGLAQASKSSVVAVTPTGVVDIPTIAAVATALNWALQKLPSSAVPSVLREVIRVAPLLALQPDLKASMVSLITQYASQITSAAKALSAIYAAPASAPPMPPATPGSPNGPFAIKLPALLTKGLPKTYPAGTIAAQAVAGSWRVAVPKGAGLGDPFEAGTHIEVAPVQSTAAPAGTVAVSIQQFEDDVSPPFYKNWKVMVPVGAGVLLLGVGAAWLLKRK